MFMLRVDNSGLDMDTHIIFILLKKNFAVLRTLSVIQIFFSIYYCYIHIWLYKSIFLFIVVVYFKCKIDHNFTRQMLGTLLCNYQFCHSNNLIISY